MSMPTWDELKRVARLKAWSATARAEMQAADEWLPDWAKTALDRISVRERTAQLFDNVDFLIGMVERATNIKCDSEEGVDEQRIVMQAFARKRARKNIP